MSSRKKRSGEQATRSRILEHVADMFNNQIDADVIKLILDQNDWQVEESVEQLFQLASNSTSTSAPSSRKDHDINLTIIACSLLDDVVPQHQSAESSSLSVTDPSSASSLHDSRESSSLPATDPSSFSSLQSSNPSSPPDNQLSILHSEERADFDLENEFETWSEESCTAPDVQSATVSESSKGTGVAHDSGTHSIKGAATKNLTLASGINSLEEGDCGRPSVPVQVGDSFEDYDELEPDLESFVGSTTAQVHERQYSSISVCKSGSLKTANVNTYDSSSVIPPIVSSSASPSTYQAATSELLCPSGDTTAQQSPGVADLSSGNHLNSSNSVADSDLSGVYNSSLGGDFDPFAVKASEEAIVEIYKELFKETLINPSLSSSVVRNGDVAHTSSDVAALVDSSSEFRSYCVTETKSDLESRSECELNSVPEETTVSLSDTHELDIVDPNTGDNFTLTERRPCTNSTDSKDSKSSNSSSIYKDKHSCVISSPQTSTSMASTIAMPISSSNGLGREHRPSPGVSSSPVITGSTSSLPNHTPTSGAAHSEQPAVSSTSSTARMGLSPNAPEFVPHSLMPSVPLPYVQNFSPMVMGSVIRNPGPYYYPTHSVNQGFPRAYSATPAPLRPPVPLQGVPLRSSTHPFAPQVPQPRPAAPLAPRVPRSATPRPLTPVTRVPTPSRPVQSLVGANLYVSPRPPVQQLTTPCTDKPSVQKQESGDRGDTNAKSEAVSNQTTSLVTNKTWADLAREPSKREKENHPAQPQGMNLHGSKSWPNVQQQKHGFNENRMDVKKGQDLVEQYTKSGTKLLVILRGLPGSGKSYLADAIKGNGKVFSTDAYFMDDGEYQFNPAMLPEAHNWNKKRVRDALDRGVTPVIVDNTNLTMWELFPYAQMADARGYEVEVMEPDTHWRYKPKQLAKYNCHGVGLASLKRMKDRFETVTTDSLRAELKKTRKEATQQTPSQGKQAPVQNCILQPAKSAPSSLDESILSEEKDPEPKSQRQCRKGSRNSKRPPAITVPPKEKEAITIPPKEKERTASDMLGSPDSYDRLKASLDQQDPKENKAQQEEVSLAWDEPKGPRQNQHTVKDSPVPEQPSANAAQKVDVEWEQPKPMRQERRRQRTSESGETSLVEKMVNDFNSSGNTTQQLIEDPPAADEILQDRHQLNSTSSSKGSSDLSDEEEKSSTSQALGVDDESTTASASSSDFEDASSQASSASDQCKTATDQQSERLLIRGSLGLISTTYSSTSEEENERSTTQGTEAETTKLPQSEVGYASPSVQPLSDAELTLSGKKKRRVKKHKMKLEPFFSADFKEKMHSKTFWKTFNPEECLPKNETPSFPQPTSCADKTEQHATKDSSTQIDIMGMTYHYLGDSVCGEDDSYHCLTGRGNSKDMDDSRTHGLGAEAVYSPTKYDKSTAVDPDLVTVEPDVELLQSVFPEHSISYLKELLDICQHNVEWAIDLLLDYDESTPFSANELASLRQELASHQEASSAPPVAQPSLATQYNPPSLVDLCCMAIQSQGDELPDDVQRAMIEGSKKRLQGMEKQQLMRARSMSFDDSDGTGFSDNIVSLAAFTATSPRKSPSKQKAPARPLTTLRNIAEEIYSSEESTQSSAGSSGSSLESSRTNSVDDLLAGSTPQNTDDLATAALVQALQAEEEEAREQQIAEDEALARWIEADQKVDEMLAAINAVPLTPDVPAAPAVINTPAHNNSGARPKTKTSTPSTPKRPKQNLPVGGIKFQDLSSKKKKKKQQPRIPSPPSLRKIMAEEEEQERIKEAKMKELEALGTPAALATKMKREKLKQHFPGLPDDFLDNIFADTGYNFERTVSLLEESLGGKANVPHKMEMEPVTSTDSEEDIQEAKRRSLKDREPAWKVQPVAGLGELEPHFHDLRQQACMHYHMRQECLSKGMDAHRRKMHGVGTFYSQQAREHASQLKLLNQSASRLLFESREPAWRQGNTLDLHGFFVDEALKVLSIVINEKTRENRKRKSNKRRFIRVITGRGKNSSGNVAKIRPRVRQFLSDSGYSFEDTHEGMLKVFL